MRRREFICLISGGAAVWPVVARAQRPAKIARIGWLGLGPAAAQSSRVRALRAGLRDLGYVEGKNIVIEFRWADTVEQLPELAAELVRMDRRSLCRPRPVFHQPARPIRYAHGAPPDSSGLFHSGGCRSRRADELWD